MVRSESKSDLQTILMGDGGRIDATSNVVAKQLALQGWRSLSSPKWASVPCYFLYISLLRLQQLIPRRLRFIEITNRIVDG